MEEHGRIPTRLELLAHMVVNDESNKSEQKKHDYYRQRIIDYETNWTIDDDPQDVSMLASEDIQIKDVEKEIHVEQLMNMIDSGQKISFDEIDSSVYRDLTVAIAEKHLGKQQRIILYHSYGFNGFDKLKAEEIRYRLEYPITIQTISKKKSEAVKKIKSFFA